MLRVGKISLWCWHNFELPAPKSYERVCAYFLLKTKSRPELSHQLSGLTWFLISFL